MSPLGTGVREAFATDAAGVWLFSSVDPDVGLKGALCCERFPTDFTSKWLLACVCPQVLLQLGHVHKLSVAVAAFW